MSRRVAGLPLLVALLVALVGQPATAPARVVAAQAPAATKASVAVGAPTGVAAPELGAFAVAASIAAFRPPPAGWSTLLRSTVDSADVTYLLAFRGRAPPSNGVFA